MSQNQLRNQLIKKVKGLIKNFNGENSHHRIMYVIKGENDEDRIISGTYYLMFIVYR